MTHASPAIAARPARGNAHRWIVPVGLVAVLLLVLWENRSEPADTQAIRAAAPQPTPTSYSRIAQAPRAKAPLPKVEPYRSGRAVRGTVQWADGTPCAEAVVRLRPKSMLPNEARAHWPQVATGADGSFAFQDTPDHGAAWLYVWLGEVDGPAWLEATIDLSGSDRHVLRVDRPVGLTLAFAPDPPPGDVLRVESISRDGETYREPLDFLVTAGESTLGPFRPGDELDVAIRDGALWRRILDDYTVPVQSQRLEIELPSAAR